MQRLGKSALLFVAIGLAIYALVYYAAEQLVYRTGKSNPFFKIATAERTEFDWVILGASHAMPLDFGDFNAFMERETGLRILNLASPGTGPLYNRFVFEHFMSKRRAKNLLYVMDSFAFYSPAWNEDRFADAKLLSRTPFSWRVARGMAQYSRNEGVDPRAVLNYVSGFAKINNRERFQADIWEGETQFDRIFRPSSSATKKRIEYLYPQGTSAVSRSRYLLELAKLVDFARTQGVQLTAIKLPLPRQFYGQLPDEAEFDAEISRLLKDQGVVLENFSTAMRDSTYYSDTDHLNRAGMIEFFARHLKRLLVESVAQ